MSVDGKNTDEMTKEDLKDAIKTVLWNTTETAANWFKDFLLEKMDVLCKRSTSCVLMQSGNDIYKFVEELQEACKKSKDKKIERKKEAKKIASTISPAESVIRKGTTKLPTLHNNAGESSEAQNIKPDEEIHDEEAETSLQEMQKALEQDGEEKEQEMIGENAGESKEAQNIKPDEEIHGEEVETSLQEMQKALEQDGEEKEQEMMESMN